MATCEAARLSISTVVLSVAHGVIDVGAATPVVAPLCVALLQVKDIIDGAHRNKEELEGLRTRCELITAHVIEKSIASKSSTIDISPLVKCVEKLEKVATRYRNQGRFTRVALFRRYGDDIQRIHARIDAIVPIMGLAGVVNNGEKLSQILDCLKPGPKLAPVPKNAPITKSWHVVRDGKVDRVCKILGGEGGPSVAALTGRSGAGKTTAAAGMVGERGPIRPGASETEDQARTRLDRLRALFPDGVVWLRVGKGNGAADRLPPLMSKLATRLHEDVMEESIDRPAVGEDGESYVKKIVSRESLRCLVVADDVWEAEVLEKLKKTGMWVLLTTRNASLVEEHERVPMDRLTASEAEDVLRGAAELPAGESLCDDAKEVLKICGHVAMDIAFVGSWSSVRAANGVPKSSKAWAGAVRKIKTQINDVSCQSQLNASGMGDLEVNRLAVLRTGFTYLGREDPLAKELYVALAVFPDGYSFGESGPAVLLGGEEVAKAPISILERWAVLRAETSGRYRMHDAHVDFARDKLMLWEEVRKPAVDRWTKHISLLSVAMGIGVYALLNMWRVLERVGGNGWWVPRPYDDQLVNMDASECSKILAVKVVAELFEHDGKFGELQALMQRVLEHYDVREGCCPEVQMTALIHIRQSLIAQGRLQESNDVSRQLGEMLGSEFQLQAPLCGDCFSQTSTSFHAYGICAVAAGRMQDAENYFRKALKAQEDGGHTTSSQAVSTLHELGRCVREAGQLREAEDLFKRALGIKETKLRSDDIGVAWTLHELGQCKLEAGQLGEAEELFQRAIEIKEKRLGRADALVGMTLLSMGRCVRDAGRLKEAEGLLKRAQGIFEAKLGASDLGVAVTLDELGRCVRNAGRLGEAEELFGRAIRIKETKLGSDDPEVGVTLYLMGRCLQDARRLEEAKDIFKQVLGIIKAKLGPNDPHVGMILYEMGRCVRDVGRPEEAEELFGQALDILEAKLGGDNPQVGVTLDSIGLCARDVGRTEEAEEFVDRALRISAPKLRSEHPQVAMTLFKIDVYMRGAQRPGEAEESLKRAMRPRWGSTIPSWRDLRRAGSQGTK